MASPCYRMNTSVLEGMNNKIKMINRMAYGYRKGNAVMHPVMPLALSFDHPTITGGKAARFLKAVMDDLITEE